MSRKILTSEIIEIIAQQQGITKKKSEAFVRAFFEVIEEGLRTDSFVKIKGFGTFKLVSVSERESVNVNTGERIQIGGHTKVAFTPDNALKDLVNRPFSHFETTLIPDSATQEDIDILNDTEEPITQIEEEFSELPTPIEKAEELPSAPIEEGVVVQTETENTDQEPDVHPTETVETESSENTETSGCCEPSEPSDISKSLENQDIITSESTESQDIITSEPSTFTPLSTSNTEEEMPTSPSSNKWRSFLIAALWVATLCISYLAGYHRIIPLDSEFHASEPSQAVAEPDTLLAPIDTLTQEIDSLVVPTRETILPVGTDTLSVIRGIKKSDAEILAKGYSQVEVGSFLIIGTYTTHVMRSGDTLLKIARQVYGHKDYVKYIIHYNHFPDPNNVYIGTEILLPQLVEKEECAG